MNYESNTDSSRSSKHSEKPLDFDKDFDENFFKRSVELQKKGQINMLEIIERHADKRTNEQRDHLVCHLMYKVPFFADYRRDLMIAICERIESKTFQEKQALMRQGDKGDCLYIIYSGKCGIYKMTKDSVGHLDYQEVAAISANSVVGQKAVMDDGSGDIRDATVLAHTEVVALRLTKKDYQQILYQHEVANRMRRLDFLNKLAFFKGWERVKLSDYNHMADEIKVTEGQTIYDIGQSASTFYVVREGKLTMETIIEIDSFFKIPVDRNRWEIRKTTRRIQYKLQELSKGSMFGHEEMLLGYDRRCRIRALTNCTLIYINKPEMDICFPPEQFNVLRGKMRNLELDQIVKKIGRYYKDKATTNQAILDATKVNTDNFGGRKMKLMGDSQ